MNIMHRLFAAAWLAAMGIAIATGSVCFAQDKSDLSQAPMSPDVKVDADATIHSGSRTIPFPHFASPESRNDYMALINSALNSGQPTDPKEYPAWAAKRLQTLFEREKSVALKLFPVDEEDGKVGGGGRRDLHAQNNAREESR